MPSAAAAAAAAAAATVVGYTRPGSASLYARLAGLTLAPFIFVYVLDFCCMFPASHLEIQHNTR